MAPKEATKPENELNAYVNMKLQAKHSRRCPPVAVGDKVHIYNKRKLFDKSRVSVWSNASYTAEGISHAHGLTFYKTSNRAKTFVRNGLLLEFTSRLQMVSLLMSTVALVSSGIIAIILKRLKCYYDDLEVIVRLHRQATNRWRN